MSNRQTCSVCDVNLVTSSIAFLRRELLHVVGDVICGPSVHVPIGVVGDSGIGELDSVVRLIRLIKPVPALECVMIRLLADLAQWAVRVVGAVAARRSLRWTSSASPLITATAAIAATAPAIVADDIASSTTSNVPVDTISRYLACRVVEFTPHLETEHVGVHIADRVRINACSDASDERVVVGAEAVQHVGDQLLIFNALADGGERVAETLDFAVVIGDAEVVLLDRGELHADLHHPCTRARRVHLLQRAPGVAGGGDSHHGGENFLAEGGVDEAEDELVLVVPAGVLRVDGDSSAAILLGWLDRDGLSGCRQRSVDEADDALAPEVRQDLGRPKQVIVLHELDVDHMIDRGRRHGTELGGGGCVGSRGVGRAEHCGSANCGSVGSWYHERIAKRTDP